MSKYLSRGPQILGICIFLVSFFLPACKGTGGGWGRMGHLMGYQCATLSLKYAALFLSGILSVLRNGGTAGVWKELPGLLLGPSGSINIMIPIYLWMERVPFVRNILAIAIILSILGTWIFFLWADFAPLIGHFTWIAGILLIVSRQLYAKSLPTDDFPDAFTS